VIIFPHAKFEIFVTSGLEIT